MGNPAQFCACPFWPIVLGNAPIRPAIVGECRSITPSIGPRKMIRDKMLSWQLASLMMAHSRKMTVTPGGSILCCGELVASRPKKPSNQLLKPPCSFASRSVLPPESPRPSLVYQSLSSQGSGRVCGWEKHGCCFCPTSEVAG